MHDDARRGAGRPDDETRPLLFAPPETPADPEPAVAAALSVIQRSLAAMSSAATRPLLDPPTQPFRLRPVAGTGVAVFPVVLDTRLLGGLPDRTGAHRVLDAYAAIGGNALVVDDAPDGVAAQTVGTWLAARRRRDSTVLLGRVGSGGLAAPQLAAAVERLLRRLGTDRLDLLVLAGEPAGTSFEETLTAGAGLVEQERAGHLVAGPIGASRLIRARVLAGQRDLPRLAGLATPYSLLRRDAHEGETAAVVHAQQLALLPTAPLAGGFLAGEAPTRSALRRLRELHPERAQRMQPLVNRRGLKVLDAVVAVAAEREVPPSAVALAWLLTRPHVAAPVVAAASVEQVWSAGAAASVHLSRAEAAALERASA
ncbi:aldo/keto reductase [Amnibacterium endophyticum]|uniref:Aldo/keto reductase n=1 Tax=Amnibacterium endophyticum TaxID=2109337 RepID=A0ABW4LGB9_9MICO